ncbi:MAG: PKD domain-containing protein [Saprospiraceae bacterium]|nr:PKD domain-containing protein [Saprospiraceae bacterium]
MNTMFQKLATLLCVLAFSFPALTQTALSGVINRYAAITAIDYCQNSAILADASGFGPGMTVLLIQMKGATINTSNTASFGDITDIGHAGRFEKAAIASLSGNTVFFQNALVNTYHTGGIVQLVYVPVYENATVTGTLSAAPWNGQTGGILALEVSGTLTLQADLDVSGKGFRGGIAEITTANNCSWLVSINGYAYGPNDWRGAAKGEGIADFAASQQTGRGAQANGGGGGNDHNAGGGGGGNVSAGGKGGNNDEPSFFGCDGFFPGRGGKPASAAAGRCYFGGGGGGGHENNELGTDGGNGGGILYLKAGQLTQNGFGLHANGADVPGTFGEGAGGGGGGGTILLDVLSLNGALLVEALGGAGGNIDNVGAERCSGPGGGGSGGRILFSGGISPVTDVSGGVAGISNNSASCNTGTNDAQPGSVGVTGGLISIPQGVEPNQAPEIAAAPELEPTCVGDLLTIPLQVGGFGLDYRWQVNTGSGFADLQDGGLYSGTSAPTLQIASVTGPMGGYVFRLAVSSNCFPTIFSQEIALTILPDPQADFSFTSTDLMATFTNASSSSTAYWWDFGDGLSSAAADPQHIYANGGEYLVRLAAINACDTAYAEMLVSVFSAPLSSFSAENVQGCAPLTIQFANQSSGSYTSLLWLFPGGVPFSSTQENPVVTYDQSGVYDVTLIALGAIVSDTLALQTFVTVLPQPVPDFSFLVVGNQVIFTNLSVNATAYNWDFGDGNGSTESNPQHIFANNGTYSVTLNAQNAYCGNAIGQTILIGINGVQEHDPGRKVRVFPNPTSNLVFIKTNDNQSIIEYEVQTTHGVLLIRDTLRPGAPVNLKQFPAGAYFLKIQQESLKQTICVIKR